MGKSTKPAGDGKTWFCMMCGKTSLDLYSGPGGWDESCMLNAIPVDIGTQPSQEQAEEFNRERDEYIASFPARLKEIRDKYNA